MRNEEALRGQGGEKYPTCNKKKKCNWIGYISSRNCLLKHIITGKIQGGAERREEKEGDVSSCWMTLKKREDIGN